MPESVALIGVRANNDQGLLKIQEALRNQVNFSHVRLDGSKFKLGSLDNMLLNLEKTKKIEIVTENFLKRIEKIHADFYPEKKLTSYKLDSKDFGPIDIEKFLKKFDWDDIRYPRSTALSDQIKHIGEKVASMEKIIKIQQQNYNDSKSVIVNSIEKKDTITNFVNRDLNETIMELMKDKRIKSLRPELFVNSEYLQSLIMFIPKDMIETFGDNYELDNEFIVPSSFIEFTEQYDYVVGHLIIFKKISGDIKITFKDRYRAITKDFAFDPQGVRNKEAERSKIISQNKTDKDLLVSTCVESFKEGLMALIHIKLYLVVIDSTLRYGSIDNLKIVLIFLDKGKEARLIQSLIKAFAEPDKFDFYGSKEQLNDVEDFYPFVYTNMGLLL